MSEPAKLDDQEKQLFADNLRRFLADEVAPHYNEWEQAGIWPRSLWRRFGEEGYLCVDVPEKFGGYGVSFELSCVVVDEVSRAGFGAWPVVFLSFRYCCSLHFELGYRSSARAILTQNGNR
jgi:alkylation response protein AidB-like acyl-CoA dehydrogenase